MPDEKDQKGSEQESKQKLPNAKLFRRLFHSIHTLAKISR
jgi:hypothetical protein